MPKNTSTISGQAGDDSSAPSVLDFLYHDSRRIGSFLAQFEGDGHLQQLTRTKDGTRGKRQSSSQEAAGSVGVASGKVLGGTETALEMAEGYARVFDPYWANARAFLDYLNEHDMIERDFGRVRMGQFALVTGSLVIADMKLLQSLWGLPAVKQVLVNAAREAQSVEPENGVDNRQQRRAKGKQPAANPAISLDLQVTMEVLPHLPHSAHLHLITEEFAVWAPASEDSLVTPPSDLMLKHGAKVAGQWSMLGILDAMPFEESELMTAMEMILTGMTNDDNLARAALSLAPTIKQAIGRPILSYGMTPLLVFREVV